MPKSAEQELLDAIRDRKYLIATLESLITKNETAVATHRAQIAKIEPELLAMTSRIKILKGVQDAEIAQYKKLIGSERR